MDSLLPGAENGEEVLSPNAAEEVVVLASGDETGSAAQAVTEPTGPGARSSVVARPEEATFFIHDFPTEDSFVDVSVDWLLDKCVVKNKQAIVFRHAAWPAKRLAVKPPEILDRAYILWGNGMISSYVDDTFKPHEIVCCVGKPKKNAVVIAPCAVQQLVLAPDSVKVNFCAEKLLDKEKFDKRARVRKQPCGYPDVAFFLNPLTSEEHVGAFWFVDTTEDKAKANMVWAFAHHTNTGGVAFTVPDNLVAGQLNGRINGKQAVATGIASAQQGLTYLTEGSVGTVLRVPVLVNRKPLKPGDVLLVFDAKKGGKRTREAVPIQVSGLVKRLKTDAEKKALGA